MKLNLYLFVIILPLIFAGCYGESENEEYKENKNKSNSENSVSKLDDNDKQSNFTKTSKNLYSKKGEEDSIKSTSESSSISNEKKHLKRIKYKYNHSSLEQFLKGQMPEKQEFIINVSKKNNLLECKKGTKLLFPKNLFVDKNGNRVKGNVKISVVEFYNFSEMIAGRMSTSSNEMPLETGGMLELRAYQNGEELKLGKYESIGIEFNSEESFKEDMQLFLGDFDTSGMMNWNEQEEIRTLLINPIKGKLCDKKNLETKNPIEFDFFESINLTEDEIAFFQDENFPELPLSITFDNDGSAMVSEIAHLPKTLSNRIIKWFSDVKCPKTQSLYLTGELNKFTMSYTNEPFPFKFNGYTPPDTDLFKESIAKNMFKATNLGWINCDRFYSEPGPKSKMILEHNMSKPPMVFVLLSSYRSMLEARLNKNGQLTLNGIPIEQEGTVYAIQVKDKQIYFAKSHVNMGSETIQLNLTKISEEDWDKNLLTIDS